MLLRSFGFFDAQVGGRSRWFPHGAESVPSLLFSSNLMHGFKNNRHKTSPCFAPICAMRLTMQAIETQEYARQLLETHGDRAVVVAAKKACSFEEKGNSNEAKTWRKIETALKLMRGPRQS